MHLQWIIVAAAYFKAVVAIPCSDFGWSTPIDNERLDGLDPFDPQGRWEVVKAKDCYVRFQSYKKDQSPDDARVTKTEFKATPEQVRGVMNNYFNEGGDNIQLWMPLNSRTYQYAKVLPGFISNDFEVIDQQRRIDEYFTTLSIILPSGVKKLEEVGPASADQGESSASLKRAGDVGITGLRGTISPEDLAYSSMVEARLVMLAIAREQRAAWHENRQPNIKNPWLAAEKLDKNECVIIDFRDFVNFFFRPRPAGSS